ncbi:hypothetical protein DERP_002674 [Dermatophagoides pteronyssinus]|uniref:Gametocyte-specific factor 1-like n=1 Tax=Dermatophagoides pteronyssinus TaxID=6956 RepID=A0ABQ8JVD8_DERPT|nr:hypothetical protein DERP_002674 [Dermatophagoides pteronyssinus]
MMRATDLFWCEHHQCDFVDQDDGDNRKKHLLPLRITNSNANRKHMREHLSTQKRLYFNCKDIPILDQY